MSLRHQLIGVAGLDRTGPSALVGDQTRRQCGRATPSFVRLRI